MKRQLRPPPYARQPQSCQRPKAKHLPHPLAATILNIQRTTKLVDHISEHFRSLFLFSLFIYLLSRHYIAFRSSAYVSISKINLTITSYMIIAAIAPAVLGNLADTVGSTQVYLVMLGVCLCEGGLRSVGYTISAAGLCTIGYGWSLQYGIVSDSHQ